MGEDALTGSPSFLSGDKDGKAMKKTKPVRIEESTIKKLDVIGKRLCEELGIKDPSYTQIIEHLLKKAEKK